MTASPLPLSVPKSDLIANVFDVLPLAAFVLDRDFNVIEFNVAGARLLDRVPFAVLRMRGGDRLQCIHSVESAEGGATEACQDCIVKNFAKEVFDGGKACRKTERMRLIGEERTAEVEFLITAVPIPDESEPLALLILEDAAELSALLDPKGGGPATLASSSPDSKAHAKAPGRKKGSS